MKMQLNNKTLRIDVSFRGNIDVDFLRTYAYTWNFPKSIKDLIESEESEIRDKLLLSVWLDEFHERIIEIDDRVDVIVTSNGYIIEIDLNLIDDSWSILPFSYDRQLGYKDTKYLLRELSDFLNWMKGYIRMDVDDFSNDRLEVYFQSLQRKKDERTNLWFNSN